MVRHGQTEYNQENRIQGWLDIPLSERGREQAERVAEELKEMHIDAIFSSDLSRAYETAREIAKFHSLEVVTTPRLREVDQGEWDGLTVEQAQERYPDEYRSWLSSPPTARPPGGESLKDVEERIVPLMEDIRSRPHRSVVIVGHKVVNLVLRLWLEGVGLDHTIWERLQNNCQMEVVEA